ncbi:CcdB family protein [Ruegeria sp. HKCCD8929]|uniref:CcdB family protein n=1 Tax=Ruegeria sp. HKCCD8929 TaxID=2683006 RepID=UPI00148793F6|nr:CcdB family protein [Ruegeria sp. HKCCD8929]
MPQFHVYELADGRLLLDLQSDLIDTGSRVVAPLFRETQGPSQINRLEPILKVNGVAYVLHTAELAAVPTSLLKGQPLADLTEFDYEIRGALDMVFSGF